jgi:uncharacterized membrane protein YidH (DUF202 family)
MTVPNDRRATRNGRVSIIVAAAAWSTAGLAQRELNATPATQVAGRALFAFLAFGRWLRTERALRREEPLPLPTLAPVLSYGLAIGAIVLLVVLLVTR